MSTDDFVATLGAPFLAHRLRRVYERLRDATAEWLEAQAIEVPARALSTVLLLKREGPASVTALAGRLRLSHPLIIKLASQLEAGGITRALADPKDARRRLIALTKAGLEQAERVELATRDMNCAVEALSASVGMDLARLCDALDDEENEHPFVLRLKEAAAIRR